MVLGGCSARSMAVGKSRSELDPHNLFERAQEAISQPGLQDAHRFWQTGLGAGAVEESGVRVG